MGGEAEFEKERKGEMGQNIGEKDSGKCLSLSQNPSVAFETPGSDKYL